MSLIPVLWTSMGLAARSENDNYNALHSLSPRRETILAIDPLPRGHRQGLIAVGVTAVLSCITTAIAFIFITHRLIFWRKYFTSYIGYNQYVILIYNLLIADFQQALGFALALEWVRHDSITSASPMCFMQGWLLQLGDPSSGLFVLSIAVHTFATVMMGRKLSNRAFVLCVIGVWAFSVVLVLIPTIRHGRSTYVPSGAWCWIDENYDDDRLWTHYFWIFLSEFGSVVIYMILFFYLRRRVATSATLGRGQKEHLRRLKRVIGYMVLYPIAYIILSLPLAAGRMATASGVRLGIPYFCTAGAIIASSGFVDVIMYTVTRKALLSDSEASNPDRFYHSNRIQNSLLTTTVTVEPKHGRKESNMLRSHHRRNGLGDEDTRMERDGSTDNIVQPVELTDLRKVYQKTTIEVTSESIVLESDSSPSSSIKDSRSPPQNMWPRRRDQ
ncbi:hypothetical protein AJ80_09580 [Polytolypa hystricis UAMH7299]|uniref:G protein-coupled receptor GPR1/2/3 C-terminal domain-containing protein n=1 Tax=Polytolypa hystricis (strain UAMH7299) TaxID=1447883 RepID=A0A2B7WNH9_POLH7|nr:hypothetical protein AJ80_09580 [Polytolypa hystricis UAMH7299]